MSVFVERTYRYFYGYIEICLLSLVVMKKSSPAIHGISIELIPDPDQGGFTARIPDIPVYGEGENEEEAIEDLKEGLIGYIETFGLQDALGRLNAPSKIVFMNWKLEDLAHG